MLVFAVGLANGIIFALYCYTVSFIVLEKREKSIKKILLALILFFFPYYCILCILESIYAIFFTGLCSFFFIKILFKESMFMALFISYTIHTLKIINKILILQVINNDNLLLVNTYKSLDWNAFYVNAGALLISTIIVFILRNPLRKFLKYITSLKNRKQILSIAIYLNFILILIYQHPNDLLTTKTLTDFLLLFTLTSIGIYSISSEMKMEALTRHYGEIFEYAKSNGELLTHYKMQVHENENRLLMIKSMLNGPKKEVKNYIDGILKEISNNKKNNNYWLAELKYIPLAGIRNFINYKLIKLTSLGTEIEVFVSSELEKIDASSIDETEYNQLTTILGVILDNMIDSIEETEKKLVSINIYIEDNKVHCEFVNTFSNKIDLSRLNEIGYTTKGEQHGIGLSLVAKIIKQNNRFECNPHIIDDFFVQHLVINMYDKNNLQKTTKK